MTKEITFCEWCREEIKRGEKCAGVHTYNEFPNISNEKYFHFTCFLEWRNQKIKEAGIKAGKEAMKEIMPIVRKCADNIVKCSENIDEEEETNQVYQLGFS
jgi:hypothetical protein